MDLLKQDYMIKIGDLEGQIRRVMIFSSNLFFRFVYSLMMLAYTKQAGAFCLKRQRIKQL